MRAREASPISNVYLASKSFHQPTRCLDYALNPQDPTPCLGRDSLRAEVTGDQGNQELFFAGRWKLQAFLKLDADEYSIEPCFYPEVFGALRRFRSCDEQSQCLETNENSVLSMQPCSTMSAGQFLDGSQLNELLAKSYAENYQDLKLKIGKQLHSAGSKFTFFDLEVDTACPAP